MKRTHKTLLALGCLLAAYGIYESLPEAPARVYGAPAASAPYVAFEPTVGPALNVLVVGDTGWGDDNERLTTAAMAADAERVPIDFVMMLGDNFYPKGVTSADDPQWQTAFVEPFSHASLDVPFYPVLGNHDYGGDNQVQVGWDGDPRWRMPKRYHTFEEQVGDAVVQFVLIDTMGLIVAEENGREKVLEKQLEWLRTTLAASDARWKIVLGHHPLRSGGRHGIDEVLVEHLEPILLEGEIDLYMAGHDHHLAWMELDTGLMQLISGAGSRPRDVDWNDETISAFTDLGFVSLRVEPERIWVQLISAERRRVLATHFIEPRMRSEQEQR